MAYTAWSWCRLYSLSVLTLYGTGQAAVCNSCMVRLLFCSRQRHGKLDRFLNRCRKLYRCQQLNQDISELFSLADQSMFSSLQKNSQHVLHRLLPAKSTQPYNLRPRRHSFSLTQKQSSYCDCNYITCMLFYDIYWLNYFLAWPRISLFHCSACHSWLLNEYMYGIVFPCGTGNASAFLYPCCLELSLSLSHLTVNYSVLLPVR